jgi:hypothetical protein
MYIYLPNWPDICLEKIQSSDNLLLPNLISCPIYIDVSVPFLHISYFCYPIA